MLQKTGYYTSSTALPVGNVTYSAEAPPALCIRSNNRARVSWIDAVCYPIDEAKISASAAIVAVVHTGDPVPFALAASRLANSISARAAFGHSRTTAIDASPCLDFSCTGEVSTSWRQL